MFAIDTTIDTIQTGKKSFVNTFVTNESVKDAMINFIDAQTAYTKQATKATTDMITTVAKESITAVQNASKFDYNKFGEGIMKAYTATTKK